MIRIIHAELLRLLRRRTMVIAAAPPLLFALVATLTVFSSARDAVGSGALTAGAAHRWRALAGTGGGTEAFAVGASFAGFLVFVTFIALHRRRVLRRHVPRPAAARSAPAARARRQAGRAPARRRPASSPWPRCSRSSCRWSSPPARTSRPREWFSASAAWATRPAGLRHRVGRRGRLGRLRHDPGRRSSARPRSPSASASPGPARSRTSSSTRGTAGYRCVPRPGAGVADPGRHHRAGHRPGRRHRRSSTPAWPPRSPSSSSPEGTSPPDDEGAVGCAVVRDIPTQLHTQPVRPAVSRP